MKYTSNEYNSRRGRVDTTSDVCNFNGRCDICSIFRYIWPQYNFKYRPSAKLSFSASYSSETTSWFHEKVWVTMSCSVFQLTDLLVENCDFCTTPAFNAPFIVTTRDFENEI